MQAPALDIGSNPRRFIIFFQNGGDLCAHRVGGASTKSYHEHRRSNRANTKQAPSRHRERKRAANARCSRSVSGLPNYHQTRRGSDSGRRERRKKGDTTSPTMLYFIY